MSRRGFEPTAPPIHMMPSYYSNPADDRELRDRSPPPRYEDAIADHWTSPSAVAPPVPAHTTSSVRIPLSPHRRTVPSARESLRQDESSSRPSSCNSIKISSPARSPVHNGPINSELRSRNSTRHRSSSPGGHSDGSNEDPNLYSTESREVSADRNGRMREVKKKRGSGSKIKKGLENIAFFIIQILD